MSLNLPNKTTITIRTNLFWSNTKYIWLIWFLCIDLPVTCVMIFENLNEKVFQFFIIPLPAIYGKKNDTLPETNITPENGWLEYDPFLIGEAYFQGRTVSFPECIFKV